jgi:NADPH:quinone reductase-like Zn-dependent oxidoreductase
MKAIHLTAYGNPAQNLRMVEVSEPNAPSASQALVRMEYAPIDYSDLLLANGVYFLNPKLPSVIGGEGAGIVEAIAPGVTSVKVGDRQLESSGRRDARRTPNAYLLSLRRPAALGSLF